MSARALPADAHVPAPSAPLGAGHPGQSSRRLYYQPLARVAVRHEYYAATGGACPDFAVRPTGWTATLMRKLGLLFREEAAGFTVLYDRLREDDLLGYVDGHRGYHCQPWTRLCFVLTLRNPLFVNFTELPVATSPATRNLYLTNRQAHPLADGTVLLAPGDRVTGAELVPAAGGQLMEPVCEDVECVRVLDVSGEAVLCKPRCVRAEVAGRKTPAQFDCGDAAPCPGAAASPPAMEDLRVCADRLYFDLGGYPEEKYLVQTKRCGDPEPATREILYTADYPVPLGLVELLLANPTGCPEGVYPVKRLGTATPAVEAVTYELRFASRRTWWSYYVIGDAPGGEPGEPRIRQQRRADEPRVFFLGPSRVCLPGGRRAWRFVSSRPLPLEQRSALTLQLLWRRDRGRRAEVVMERLPVASAQQVLPMLAGEAHVQARQSLCGPAPPGFRSRGLLAALRDPLSGSPARRIFSDIYVNV